MPYPLATKPKMKTFFLILGFFLTLQFVNGQTKNFIDQPYLETKAKVDTLVKPDRIYLDILLREKDNRNMVSVEELENKMASKLESMGINLKEQLILSDLASNFKTYFLKQKNVVKRKAYTLKVFDALTAGKVLVELENIGISNVSLDKIEYSKKDELKLVLKSKAVKKAKTQAEYLVEPLNQSIGEALYILDKYYETYDYDEVITEVDFIGFDSKQKTEYNPVEIEFKSIRVETEVTVIFKLN